MDEIINGGVSVTDRYTIAQNIQKCRKKANVTQLELAEKLNVNRSLISKYENGEIVPPLNKIEPLAEALKVSIFEIMGDTAYYVAYLLAEARSRSTFVDGDQLLLKYLLNEAGYDVDFVQTSGKYLIRGHGAKYELSRNDISTLISKVREYFKFIFYELINNGKKD